MMPKSEYISHAESRLTGDTVSPAGEISIEHDRYIVFRDSEIFQYFVYEKLDDGTLRLVRPYYDERSAHEVAWYLDFIHSIDIGKFVAASLSQGR